MGINFPASPTVGQKYPAPPVAGVPVYTWDGEKWTTVGGSIAAYAPPADAVPLMDATPGLVGTATEYAREDHVHPTDTSRASAHAMAYSGMQINGGFDVSQELGINGISGNGYVVDGWVAEKGGSMTISTYPLGAMTSASGLVSGIPNYLEMIITVADTTLAAPDYVSVYQPIEGYRTAKLAWGTANAQPITISFWSSHNRTGLYSVAISNGSSTRSYVATYTHAAANVAQYNTITIPGDTSGTWASGNTAGMYLQFTFACGSTLTAPAANAWNAAAYLAAPGQVNGAAATSDVFRITGVTVLPGTQAPTAAQSPLVMRPYGEELATCLRYYETIELNALGQLFTSALLTDTFYYHYWAYRVRKRADPTVNGMGPIFTPITPDYYSSPDGLLFQHGTSHFYLSGAAGDKAFYADARF